MPLIAPHTMLGSHLLAGEPVGPHASRQVILHITGATNRFGPNMYWRSSVRQVGSSGNSTNIERMTGVPFRCGCRPVWNRYGMSESLSLANVRATSTAATTGFHKIRRFVGVQELATVLGDLREGFAFELDFNSGFLFKGFRGATPCLGLTGVVFLVVPERQAIWRFLVLRGVAAACSERGQRQCCDGHRGQSSFHIHFFSPCFPSRTPSLQRSKNRDC